jgi:hypothetical protein
MTEAMKLIDVEAALEKHGHNGRQESTEVITLGPIYREALD